MTEFIERHPVKTQVATIMIAALFIISTTTWFNRDRSEVLSRLIFVEKELCDLADVIEANSGEIKEQRAKVHDNEVVLAEVRGRLVSIEALLVNLNMIFDKEQSNNLPTY